MVQCSNVGGSPELAEAVNNGVWVLSKQLAISIAFSVMTMSAFALSMAPSMAPSQPLSGQAAGQKNGAIAEAAAPSFFSVFAN